jgi:hypothetical protein
MKTDAIHELITAAKALSPSSDGRAAHFHHLAEMASAELARIPSPYTQFLAGDHRVEIDPRRSLIMVDCFTYSVGRLADGLIAPECPHGQPLLDPCAECDREHREATR